MNGQRAVFERGILAQRPLLIRAPTRSKQHMDMPSGSGIAVSSGGASELCGSKAFLWEAVNPVGAKLARDDVGTSNAAIASKLCSHRLVPIRVHQ
ncbi:hypothetical protein B1219_12020 [Pseudomonas ogarae]|nr:hypothetical protein B1219_12020 [Pseudomonas ogarae]OPG79580.1 hypothetical protein B1218_09700 [Pseudomonas ogarae]